MKKFLLLSFIAFSSFVFSQSEYNSAYKEGFADALCYRKGSYCQRRAPYDSNIPLPSYNERADYSTGYIKGIVDGFKYRNSEDRTNYDFSDYMNEIVQRKIESRRRTVENYEKYLDDDLRARHPRPKDPRQAEIYDKIMSNDLDY
ncbi:hypothetical protein [Chryseobacterium aureum]|uniref:hypothetical protein n=1 Tax=Chryseobacterium aureum TaxID=2497456 RepID=UPI000F885D6C|nr:hypothetical protein [Chryseobacterium aureum]